MEVSKLQSGVSIDSNNVIHGILHHVKEYKKFSSVPSEQSGNYVALKFITPTGSTVKIQSSTGNGEQTLAPDDRVLVWRVKDTSATLTVTVENGDETAKEVYSASGLILETE